MIASALAFFCRISIAGGSLAISFAPSKPETAVMSLPPSSLALSEKRNRASPSRTVTLSINARDAYALTSEMRMRLVTLSGGSP